MICDSDNDNDSDNDDVSPNMICETILGTSKVLGASGYHSGKICILSREKLKRVSVFLLFSAQTPRTEKIANVIVNAKTISCTLEVFSPLMTS